MADETLPQEAETVLNDVIHALVDAADISAAEAEKFHLAVDKYFEKDGPAPKPAPVAAKATFTPPAVA